PHALASKERENRACIRARGGFRSRSLLQQHVRDGMASALGQAAKFSGDRPYCLFCPSLSAQKNFAGTAPLYRGVGRALEKKRCLIRSCRTALSFSALSANRPRPRPGPMVL